MTKKRFTKLLMSYGFKLDLIKLFVSVIQTLAGKVSYIDVYSAIIESVFNDVINTMPNIDTIDNYDYVPCLSEDDIDKFNHKIYSACGIPSKFLIDGNSDYSVKIKPFEIGQTIIMNENDNNLNIT